MLVAKKDDIPVKNIESVNDGRFTGYLKRKEFARDPTHKDFKKDERPLRRAQPQKRFP